MFYFWFHSVPSEKDIACMYVHATKGMSEIDMDEPIKALPNGWLYLGCT